MKLLKAELENESSDKLIEMIYILRKSVKLNDELFSILLHDLISPISAISSLTKLIVSKNSNFTESEIYEAIHSISHSSSSVLELINDSMQMLKHTRGEIHFNKEELLLNNLIKECLDLLELNIKNKNLNVKLSIPTGIRINTDINICITIIRNLLSNAIKYSYEGGEIEIGITDKNSQNQVEVYIKDYGSGLNAVELNTILKDSPTISKEGTLKEKGLGIGLFICRDLALKNDGDIWVESKEGEWTTFYISFTKV